MSTHPRRIRCTSCDRLREVRYSVDAATYVCAACGKAGGPIRVTVDDPSWRRQALCATPAGLQTMEYAGEGFAPAVRDAKGLCALCPAADACLAAAMASEHGSSADHRWGVRGGMTAAERYTLHRRNRRAAA